MTLSGEEELCPYLYLKEMAPPPASTSQPADGHTFQWTQEQDNRLGRSSLPPHSRLSNSPMRNSVEKLQYWTFLKRKMIIYAF
jgi:hypothetical protein